MADDGRFRPIFASESNAGEAILLSSATPTRVHTVEAGPAGTYDEIYMYIGLNQTTGMALAQVWMGTDPNQANEGFFSEVSFREPVLVIPGQRLGPGRSIFVEPSLGDRILVFFTINRFEPVASDT